MEKICILFRGDHERKFKTRGGDNIDFNYINNIENLKKNVIKPLSLKYETDIYIHTFNSNIIDSFQEHFSYYKKKIIEKKNKQPNNILDAVNIIENAEQYSYIIILRFDLEFKQEITNILPLNKGIYFTFHEGSIDRVDDTMHIILGGDLLLHFKNALIQQIQKTTYECCHYLINFIKKSSTVPIYILLNDKFYGSDTAANNILAKNPIFKLHSRPYYFTT